MIDRRSVERAAALFQPPDGSFERLVRRRSRKRRNQRIAAVVVGVMVALASAFAGSLILRSEGRRPLQEPTATATPAVAGSSILRPGEHIDQVGADGEIVAVNDPANSVRRLAGCGGMDGCRIGEFAVSPDGAWLEYEVYPLVCQVYTDCTANPKGGIWVTDGTNQVRVTPTGCMPSRRCNDLVAWAPTGSLLVVAANGDRPEVFTYDAETAAKMPLAEGSPGTAFAWSADGSVLAYAVGGDTPGVFVADLRTGRSVLVTDHVGSVDEIVWSPDGTKLALDDFIDDRNHLDVVGVDGSNFRVLVDQGAPQGPGAPAWSPDGTRIAYATTPGGDGRFTFEVWIIGVDGSSPTRIYRSDCCFDDWEGPVWSPDGTRVAFMDNSSGSNMWRVASANGRGLVTAITEAEAESWRRP